MDIRRSTIFAATLYLWGCGQPAHDPSGLGLAVSFPQGRSAAPLDGRLLLILARDGSSEPRFQISAGPRGQQIFGIDVHDLEPGVEATIDATAFGFPLASLDHVPQGTYWVQALLNRYERFQRSDGHTLELPPDRGEGQEWNRKPGNLYSTPRRVLVDPSAGGVIHLSMDQVIPPLPEEDETKYVKHVSIQSELLTAFWGTPVTIEATVLLPEGWADHPDARYPLMVYQAPRHRGGGSTLGFRETPPTAAEKLDGPGLAFAQAGHALYREWTGPDFPRFILVAIQDANPYSGDSYAVNSANLGPYGDALTYELVPHIESRFRGIGAGWARALHGEARGGWESLALQLFYPDEYNGAWALCPDPVDFSDLGVAEFDADGNAYYQDRDRKRTLRPGTTDSLGNVTATLEEQNHFELALASHGRSGGQWDVWQAVFGPVGPDGYPAPVWDKYTGEIHPEVAQYWRDNYDLPHLLERDWPRLRPRLGGKLHIYVGAAEGQDPHDAFHLAEEFLKDAGNPHDVGTVERTGLAWSCGSTENQVTQAIRPALDRQMASLMLGRVLDSAPPGVDLVSWRY